MSLSKFEGAINTIQSLSNRPSQDGLTPAQVKTKFDKAIIDLKAYINDTLTAEIDTALAAMLGDMSIHKGLKDCSTNPDYPAGNQGEYYDVSVAGKIGGASGSAVNAGDVIICNVDDTDSGDQAAVGSAWTILPGRVTLTLYALADHVHLSYLRGLTNINCSTNPDYPAATAGTVLRVSSGGTIGSGSDALNVQTNDLLVCVIDASGGDYLKWTIIKGSKTLRHVADVDYSSNPNYPIGHSGEFYKATVAGKVGGASGTNVFVGDLVLCVTASYGGDEATAGSKWTVLRGKVAFDSKSDVGHDHDESYPAIADFDALNSDFNTLSGNFDTLSEDFNTLNGIALKDKGDINCSTNPSYPTATAGEIYKVSVAGKIGGASGQNVRVNDLIICVQTDATGDATKWTIIHHDSNKKILDLDCSTNPSYPVARVGDWINVTFAGKMGGASGKVVNAGDMVVCITDNTTSGTSGPISSKFTVFYGPASMGLKADILEAFTVVTHSAYTHTFNLASVRNFQTTLEDATARTFALSNFPSTSGKKAEFMIEVIATAAPAVTYPASFVWKDAVSPIYTAGKKYIITGVSFDGGTTIKTTWGEF